MPGILRSIGTAVICTLVVSSVAAAQAGQPARPYRGLFGGNEAAVAGGQLFDLNVSLYGGYDDNALADVGTQVTPDPRFQQNTRYAGGQVSVQYAKNGSRLTLDSTAGTGYRYYESVGGMSGNNHWASLGLTGRLSQRSTVRASGGVNYSPYFGFAGITGLGADQTGQATVPSSDFAQASRAALTANGALSFDHRLTQRMTMDADVSVENTRFTGDGVSFRNVGGGGGFRYRMTNHATARLGYHYRRGTYPTYGLGRLVEAHDIDVGVDYTRSLSFSRRTTFGFSTGSSIYRSYNGAQGVVSGDPGLYRTHYLVTGNAYLNRQIGRTWNARLDYRRGLQMVEGFPQPFLSDSVMGTLGGYWGRRLRFGATGQYSNGEVGERSVSGRNFTTYTAAANLELAVSRLVALTVDGLFYHYVFDQSIELPEGIGRGLDRRTIRCGVTIWLPLAR
jgi:hypothetical protein